MSLFKFGLLALFTNLMASRESNSTMDLSNLQEKWRDYFDFLDMNNDSVLDIADVRLCQDNYVRLHNLTKEEGVFPTQRILTIWKQLTFRGEVGSLNKSEFVSTCTKAYETNPEVYIREIRAAYTDFMSLFDVNMNQMIEIDEHLRFYNYMGFTSEIDDMASIRVAYNNTDSIPLADVVDIWLQFRSGTSTNVKNDTIDQAIRTVMHEEL